MNIFQTWKTMKAWVIQAKHDARAAAESAYRHGRQIKDIERILTSAGLADFHLYRAIGESAIDVAELEVMVHMLADHLDLEWVTVPETSSWEESVETKTVIEHALGVLTVAATVLDADGVQHPAVDAARTELSKLRDCSCST